MVQPCKIDFIRWLNSIKLDNLYNIETMYNEKFENHIETCANEFLENKDRYSEIISIHHTDADGITAAAIINQMVTRLKKKIHQFSFDLDTHWKIFIEKIEKDIQYPSAIIFSDLCPPETYLIDLLENHSDLDIYILDHHFFQKDSTRKSPDNLYNCNPTLFGLNGLKEIVGSTLNYLFAKQVSEKNQNLAWLAVIGMGGDTLDHINDYKSYNRLVIDEAVELNQIEIHNGLCLFGGQFERIDNALSLSILPYIPKIEGNSKIAKLILNELEIDPSKKLELLSEKEVNLIATYFKISSLKGEFVSFPKKKGILKYAFEHAQMVSIIGHSNPAEAIRLLGALNVSKEQKIEYMNFVKGIVENLTRFVKMVKIESKNAIIVNLTNKIPIEMWSNIGSFASINQIYDIDKMLFIGGETSGEYKFSVRCTQNFIKSHNNSGVNVVIKKISEKIGANGGGHGLAGGMKIQISKYTQLVNKIDQIIDSL